MRNDATREKATRLRPSRARIISAYVDLLQGRDPSSITIKELVSHANSNRSTFYAYFSKVDDVAECVMESFFESFREANEPYRHGTWVDSGTDNDDQGAVSVYSFVFEHHRELTALLNSPLRAEFIDRWVACIQDEYERYDYEFFYADETPANLTEQELGYQLHSLAHLIVAYMEFWSDTGFQESPEELAELMPRLMSLSTKHGRRIYRIKRAGE